MREKKIIGILEITFLVKVLKIISINVDYLNKNSK